MGDAKMSGNLTALFGRLTRTENTAFDLIGDILKRNGVVGHDDLSEVARTSGVPVQYLRTISEFYDELRPAPGPAPRVRVCNGEACRATGGNALGARLEKGLDGDVGTVTCLGLCSRGPNLSLDGRVVTADGPETVDEVVAAVRDERQFTGPEPENPIHFPAPNRPSVLLGRLRDGDAARAVDYPAEGYAALEKALTMTPDAVVAEITASGLRGRGGAGFPAGRKLEAVAQSPSPDGRRFVVANLDEGDAGAFIDKELAERDPHALIEGMLIAAHACGAREAFIYIRHEYPHAHAILQKAVDEAHRDHQTCTIHLVKGQGSYICGEETSLLRSIEGVAPQVSLRPPYPAQEGLHGCPTAVNNVETLCNLPWIILNGGAAYGALGMEGSSGTKLISINNQVRRPGLHEVEMGVSVRDIIFDLAGGMADGRRFQAVQIGGPLGAILPESALDVPLGFEALDRIGGTLGHGGMVVFSYESDLLSVARDLMAFCAWESCGKCFPCRIGTVRGVELLDHIAADGLTDERESLLRDLCETLRLGSLCGLGGMAPVPIESLLTHFPEIWPRAGGGGHD
jgi:formate dehydrogenase iron-sulfur subunit